MKYLAVMPWVFKPYYEACRATMHPEFQANTLFVDNSVKNLGIMRSQNIAAQRVMDEKLDWLIILSAAIRFGEKGGLDFIKVLEDNMDHYVIHGSTPHGRGVFGWHLTAFSRDLLENVGMFDENFCVDRETEILTRSGWKFIDEFSVGDETLTLNSETGFSEWQPIQHIFKSNVTDQKMIKMTSKNHSSVTTPNHRWLVERSHQHFRGPGGHKRAREFTSTEELRATDRIQCTAKLSEFRDATFSDDFVKLAGWYWTEGNAGTSDNQGVTISQSHKVNSPKVAEIHRILVELFGPPVLRLRVSGNTKVNDPQMWREDQRKDGMTVFRLNRTAALELRKVVLGFEKIISSEFIHALTSDQLNMFLDASIEADGHAESRHYYDRTLKEGVRRRIAQKNKSSLDILQMALATMGINSAMSYAEVKYKGGIRPKWILSIHEVRNHVAPIHATKHTKYGPTGTATVIEELYTGPIWCVTTKNSTWMARRQGKIYFTGNSPYGLDDIDLSLRIQNHYKGCAGWAGFPVDVTDTTMSHSISLAGVKSPHGPKEEYFIRKWGRGGAGWDQPHYATPFNNPDNSLAYWPKSGEKFANQEAWDFLNANQ